MATYTVVFDGHPKNIPGNPFDAKTAFGTVVVLSVGNVCDDADCYREALQEIADRGDDRASRIAQKALDERHAALTAALAERAS